MVVQIANLSDEVKTMFAIQPHHRVIITLKKQSGGARSFLVSSGSGPGCRGSDYFHNLTQRLYLGL